jgi:subtilisin family serine protease
MKEMNITTLWSKCGGTPIRLAVAFVMLTLCGARAMADNIVAGHVLVRVASGVDIRVLAAVFKTTAQNQVAGTSLYSVNTPRGVTETQFAARLSRDRRVLYAEPDLFIISPEVDGAPFHLAFDRTQTSTTYINALSYAQVNLGQVDALGQIHGNSPLATGGGIIVAVLDTGATFTHRDLQGHYLAGYNALAPNTLPWDVADGTTNAEVGHGTMIAGIIARLAPRATIMPVRVLNGDGNGTLLTLVQGLHYATTHGARVINMSFSCTTNSGALNDALGEAEQMGIVLVAAAGNNSVEQPLTPAVGRGTLAVGAVDADNTKSSFSNFGSYVRVVAPGSSIRSTFADGGYATWSGTSFAAPFVAAEAALVLSVAPSLTAAQVSDCIRGTAHSVDNNNKPFKGKLGKGIIDIEAAVKAVHP